MHDVYFTFTFYFNAVNVVVFCNGHIPVYDICLITVHNTVLKCITKASNSRLHVLVKFEIKTDMP